MTTVEELWCRAEGENDLHPLDLAFVYSISYFSIQRIHTHAISYSSAACDAGCLQEVGEKGTYVSQQ